MSRPLSVNEAAWARHLIRYGEAVSGSPSVTQRLAWLDFLETATAGKTCSCGTCPSVELLDAGGLCASGPASCVLEGGTTDLLILLHVIDGRPAYLEGAPSTHAAVPAFPAIP